MTGIETDTGSFRHSCKFKEVFELVERTADRSTLPGSILEEDPRIGMPSEQ